MDYQNKVAQSRSPPLREHPAYIQMNFYLSCYLQKQNLAYAGSSGEGEYFLLSILFVNDEFYKVSVYFYLYLDHHYSIMYLKKLMPNSNPKRGVEEFLDEGR